MAYRETKIAVRVYLSPEEHEYLKAVAEENKTSMTELLKICTLKKCKFPQKKVSQKIAIPSTATTTAHFDLSTEEMENRLLEVNEILNKAYNGEKLPHNEYTALKEEQAKLRSILNHN